MSLAHGTRSLLVAGTLALLMAACAPLPRERGPSPREQHIQAVLQEARQLEAQGQYRAAAQTYQLLAATLDAPHRQRVRMHAVDALLEAGDVDAARRQLERVDTGPLEAVGRTRHALLGARLALLEGQPETALTRIPEAAAELPPELRRGILETRARALGEAGHPVTSARAYLELASLLPPEARQASYEQALAALRSAHAEQIRAWRQAHPRPEPTFAAWLDLGETLATVGPDTRALDAALEEWRRRHPRQRVPEAVLSRIRQQWQSYGARPEQVALLLPLSGDYASVARPILHGLLAAYYGSSAQRPRLQLYDTGASSSGIQAVYERAAADGAALVIGPLAKDRVTELASLEGLKTPVLTLNYTPEANPTAEGLYEFGLLPEDEARQAGERAYADGHRRAGALIPEGEWGSRLLKAFRNRFEDLGGTLVGASRYSEDETDHAVAIKRLLKIERSRERYRTPGSDLQGEPRPEPRPRHAVDMVFMAATPRHARLLRPQLEFHHASNLPVYATSHITPGRRGPDPGKDLGGVVFCDLPWIIDPPPLRDDLADQLPDASQRYPRLIALGMDAYRLAAYLSYLQDWSDGEIEGHTGRLRLEGGRIHRELPWARFKNGEIQPVGTARQASSQQP